MEYKEEVNAVKTVCVGSVWGFFVVFLEFFVCFFGWFFCLVFGVFF